MNHLIIKLHKELIQRIDDFPKEFLAESYQMNKDWGDKMPRNSYNRFGHSQIADYCYEKQFKALSPKFKN